MVTRGTYETMTRKANQRIPLPLRVFLTALPRSALEKLSQYVCKVPLLSLPGSAPGTRGSQRTVKAKSASSLRKKSKKSPR